MKKKKINKTSGLDNTHKITTNSSQNFKVLIYKDHHRKSQKSHSKTQSAPWSIVKIQELDTRGVTQGGSVATLGLHPQYLIGKH